MQYVVILKDQSVFETDWYRHENCWNDDIYCVVDTLRNLVTFDGKSWVVAEEDHL